MTQLKQEQLEVEWDGIRNLNCPEGNEESLDCFCILLHFAGAQWEKLISPSSVKAAGTCNVIQSFEHYL